MSSIIQQRIKRATFRKYILTSYARRVFGMSENHADEIMFHVDELFTLSPPHHSTTARAIKKRYKKTNERAFAFIVLGYALCAKCEIDTYNQSPLSIYTHKQKGTTKRTKK